MKLISMTMFRRPEYAKRVLEALSKCDGIEDYTLVISIDGSPMHPGIRDLCRLFRESCIVDKIIILPANQQLGCNRNTKRVLNIGFGIADYVIHVEDDVVLAPDALRYFEWAKQFGSDKSVFTVGAWCHGNNKGIKDPELVGRQHFFTCWGWATWKDRWNEIAKKWTMKNDMVLSWDSRMSEIRDKRVEIVPYVSRAINIGDLGGTHRGASTPDNWAGEEGFKKPTTYRMKS